MWRAFRSRRALCALNSRVAQINASDILCFACVRNEANRLPYFLQHYRALGVDHFLIVDNGSDDGSAEYLFDQPDVSIWRNSESYKAARFGMDWLNWLLWRYGAGHWCLTVDADELFIYPDYDKAPLKMLTRHLDDQNLEMMGALMLDLYPKGALNSQTYTAGQNPTEVLNFFDSDGYWSQVQPKMENMWLQGGPRARCFFSNEPRRAPTMNKTPLVRWRRGYAYVSSTHNALPARLNHTYDEGGIQKPTGILLHTKFLPDAAARARVEKARKEHFSNSALYDAYYDAVANNPDLWCPASTAYQGPEQLERLGLMQRGGWSAP